MIEILKSFKNTVIKNYFNFKGRASRREYWSFALVYFLFYIPSWLFLISLILAPQSVVSFVLMFASLLGILGILAITCPFIALAVRRLHDIGKSGWWLGGYLIFNALITLFSNAFKFPFGEEQATETSLISLIFTLIIALIIIVWYILLTILFPLMKGQKGANQYGEDPYKDL